MLLLDLTHSAEIFLLSWIICSHSFLWGSCDIRLHDSLRLSISAAKNATLGIQKILVLRSGVWHALLHTMSPWGISGGLLDAKAVLGPFMTSALEHYSLQPWKIPHKDHIDHQRHTLLIFLSLRCLIKCEEVKEFAEEKSLVLTQQLLLWTLNQMLYPKQEREKKQNKTKQ